MSKQEINGNELPPYELELILAHILKKSREYVLAHPEIKLTKKQEERRKKYEKRRLSHEPMAYILGHKEFYGLDFKVTRDTLIPRPETELLVEEVLKDIQDTSYKIPATIMDIGTGSGNIIISIAKNNGQRSMTNINYFATDISEKAIRIAKHNAKENNLDKKIKFIKSNLLEKFIQDTRYKIQDTNLIILANLPYLSQKIYSQTLPNVKNYEPKSALVSGIDGLDHYKKLFKQMKKLKAMSYKLKAYLEFSPEQKTKLEKLIKIHFPAADFEFKKDLDRKWRLAIIKL